MSHECQITYEVPIIDYTPNVASNDTVRIYSKGGAAYALFPDGTVVELTIGVESLIHDNWFSLST